MISFTYLFCFNCYDIIHNINIGGTKMHKLKLKNINNPFEMRQGEKIVDLDRYVEVLKENNISFTKEQYEEAKKNLGK